MERCDRERPISVGRGLAPAEKITRIKYCFRRLVGKPPYNGFINKQYGLTIHYWFSRAVEDADPYELCRKNTAPVERCDRERPSARRRANQIPPLRQNEAVALRFTDLRQPLCLKNSLILLQAFQSEEI